MLTTCTMINQYNFGNNTMSVIEKHLKCIFNIQYKETFRKGFLFCETRWTYGIIKKCL